MLSEAEKVVVAVSTVVISASLHGIVLVGLAPLHREHPLPTLAQATSPPIELDLASSPIGEESGTSTAPARRAFRRASEKSSPRNASPLHHGNHALAAHESPTDAAPASHDVLPAAAPVQGASNAEPSSSSTPVLAASTSAPTPPTKGTVDGVEGGKGPPHSGGFAYLSGWFSSAISARELQLSDDEKRSAVATAQIRLENGRIASATLSAAGDCPAYNQAVAKSLAALVGRDVPPSSLGELPSGTFFLRLRPR